MRALITGAAGQLGRALRAAAPPDADLLALSHAELDIADAAAVEAALATHRPDLVINAAAYTAVDRAERERDAAWRANRDGPAQLAAAALRTGTRLVHVSTDHVFDGRASRPYPPDHPPAPLGVYGASKAAGEAAVHAIMPDALIVRTAWLYSADGDGFLRRILRAAAGGQALRVVADQQGTPTHAPGLARALWQLVAREATGLHHFTDGGSTSRHGFAVAIVAEAAAAGLIDSAPAVAAIASPQLAGAAPRPAYGVLDCSRTWALLGETPPPWRAGVRAAIRGMAHG